MAYRASRQVGTGSAELTLSALPTRVPGVDTLKHSSDHEQRSAESKRSMNHATAGSSLGWTALDFTSALLGAVAAARISLLLSSHAQATANRTSSGVILCAMIFAFCVIILSSWSHLRYRQRADASMNGVAQALVEIPKSVALAAFFTRCLALAANTDVNGRLVMAWEVALTCVAMVATRAFWHWRRVSWRSRGHGIKNFAIAGISPEGRNVRDYLTSLSFAGYSFKGFIALDENDAAHALEGETVLGNVDNIMPLARSLFVDEIFLMRRPRTVTLVQALEDARVNGIDMRLIPGLGETLQRRTDVHYVGDMPTIVLHRSRPQEIARFCKRILDVTVAALVLILLSPVLLVLALAVALDSRGPVLYGSERVGLKGRTFRCYKFRTMVPNADRMKAQLSHLNERDGILFKITNDPRITRVGRILRKYSLDELPQLCNVLRGDMSLVGPRPPIGAEVAQYRIDQFCRLEVMPGITGLWQVEARSDPSFESYIELDRKYVNDWSFWFDLKILFRTVDVVLRGTGS